MTSIKHLSLRQFAKDYRLPLNTTIVFIALLLLLLLLRNYEMSVLGSTLQNKAKSGQDYASLLSSDKDDAFNKNDVNSSSEDEKKSEESKKTETSSAFTVSPSGSATSTSSTSENGSQTSTGNTAETQPSTPPPFSAAIMKMGLINSSINCPTATGISGCYKRYVFKADVQAVNGPGMINYSWETSLDWADSDGDLTAPAGESYLSVPKDIAIRCDQPTHFNIKFVITSPNSTESFTLPVDHNCTSIL